MSLWTASAPVVGNICDRLPRDVLAKILHPGLVDKQARLVCSSWHAAYEDGIQRATLRLSPMVDLGSDLPHAPRKAPRLQLDACNMALGCPDTTTQPLDMARLAGMLQRWRINAPLELRFSSNSIDARSLQVLTDALQGETFAAFGVQTLDLTSSTFQDLACGQLLASVLRNGMQLAPLRELHLKRCDLSATHVRSLTLLDLSGNSRLGAQGAAAVAACLLGAPHLSSLRQLLLRAAYVGPEPSCVLVSAIVQARLALTTVDMSYNIFGDCGAAAWAAALSGSTPLAGLETLNLDGNDVSQAGLSLLEGALQAATHITSLKWLGLRVNDDLLGPCAEGVARLWRAAPHIAASLQALDLSETYLSGGALAAACDAMLEGGLRLPSLSRLDVTRTTTTQQGRRQLCAALLAGTHLTGLRELDFSIGLLASESGRLSPTGRLRLVGNGSEADEGNGEGWPQKLAATLVASTHLSGLRTLGLFRTGLDQPGPMTDLLRAAPHLRGLTTLWVNASPPPTCTVGMQLLQLLPALRRLYIVRMGDDRVDELELAAALEHAPCAPFLELIGVYFKTSGTAADDDPLDAAIERFAAVLQACPHLPSLHLIEVICYKRTATQDGLRQFGGMLGACGHLSGLHHLRLHGFCRQNNAEERAVMRQQVYEGLKQGGQLAAMRVVVA